MTDSEILQLLRERLTLIEQRIQAACDRVGRQRSEITLVAVTKTIGVQVARLLPTLGILDLGESRPQELWRKATALADLPIRWHMIGHLQRNKIERSLPLISLLHSVDSERLLDALNKEAGKRGSPLSVLIEVNASREVAKGGFPPETVPSLLADLTRWPHIRIEGFMTMAAYSDNPEHARATFREIRQFSEQRPAGVGPERSMGMSNDFEIAIEEGATLIRLGTILFEGLPADA